MKKFIPYLILGIPTLAICASIATTPVVPTLQETDRIPIGRPLGSTAYTTTPAQLLTGYRNFSTNTQAHRASNANPHNVSATQIGLQNYNGSAGFDNISTNGIFIRQGDNAQALELFEAAANGSDTVTIAVQSQMSSSRSIVIGNHGLYVDGVAKITW